MSKDYEIGYGKPPKDTQFKPGCSGNKKGRTKGSKNLSTIFKALAYKKFPVEENGKQIRATRVQMMFMSALNKAAKGDLNAAKFIFPILEKIEHTEGQREKIMESLSADNKEILLTYLKNNAEAKDGSEQ